MPQKQFTSSEKKYRAWTLIFFILTLIGGRVFSYIDNKFDDWWVDMVDEYISSNGSNIISWIIQNPFNLISTLSVVGLAILGIDILIRKAKLIKAEAEKLKNNEKILVEPKMSIQPDQDDLQVQKDFVFKQIKLGSKIPQDLLSCYATVCDVYLISENVQHIPIKLASNELVWAKSNSSILNNRTNLVEGISKKLYVARINPKKKIAEIVGVNNYYTPISEGTYHISIRLDGENFTQRAFSITIFYDGKKSIEFKNISGLSIVQMAYTNLNMGISIKTQANTFRKNNFLLSIIEFLEKIKSK